jgi:hypothetical protein
MKANLGMQVLLDLIVITVSDDESELECPVTISDIIDSHRSRESITDGRVVVWRIEVGVPFNPFTGIYYYDPGPPASRECSVRSISQSVRSMRHG